MILELDKEEIEELIQALSWTVRSLEAKGLMNHRPLALIRKLQELKNAPHESDDQKSG